MDKIILGMLLLKKSTVYEIRSLMNLYFRAICSASMGSIQAALKKLLAADMITYTEYVKKSVNRKQYEITVKGRRELVQWLQIPANISAAKNMELGKLPFLGLMPDEMQMSIIDEIIQQLENDLSQLLDIQASKLPERKKAMAQHWQTDINYFSAVMKKAASVSAFEELTLQYTIDLTRFNIEWFKGRSRKGLQE